MSNYFSRYCALLGSSDQLEYCKQAISLDDLLIRIKSLWNCSQLSNDELLGEINHLNKIPVDDAIAADETINLAGIWLPYRYQSGQQLVSWLIPHGHATEPFHDEYISRCRQQLLLNQIIQPCSSLEFAQQQAEKLDDVQPAGFIFHLSRCGSTLVSGCLSELDSTCVFSESPLLTALLLDYSLAQVEQQISLGAFINLQAAAFPARPRMIIKWNAWDIFHWDLIRSLYPRVPVIFLVRNPVEILASHQHSAGRHMAQDPGLVHVHPVFNGLSDSESLLGQRIQILQCFLQAMKTRASRANVQLVDYQYLSTGGLLSILNTFGCDLDESDSLKVQERTHYHSKSPGQMFIADNVKKQRYFSSAEREEILSLLLPEYNHLIKLAHKTREHVINVC